jgi:hypothetical protein
VVRRKPDVIPSGIIHGGQQVDDGVHRLQQSLRLVDVAGAETIEHPSAALPDRFTESVQVRHGIDTHVHRPSEAPRLRRSPQ